MDRDDKVLDYLQDRMGPEDRAGFEREMDSDPSLAAEVAMLTGARRAMAEETLPDGASEAGWARLSEAIAEDQATPPANTNRPLAWAQAAAIAAAAIAVWQFAVVPRFQGAEPGLVPASDTIEGPALRAAFAADAPLSEVTALLREVGATVIDGPSAVGLYTLAFRDAGARDSAEAALTDRPDLVTAVARP